MVVHAEYIHMYIYIRLKETYSGLVIYRFFNIAMNEAGNVTTNSKTTFIYRVYSKKSISKIDKYTKVTITKSLCYLI